MIRTVMISSSISAQGKLLRTLPGGKAVVDTGLSHVIGTLLNNEPTLKVAS